MTEKQKYDIFKCINSQEGQNYPCSNQIVCCGYFSSEENWQKFCEKNKDLILYKIKDKIKLKNGEVWRFFNYIFFSENIRGFRFYKIKIDKNIIYSPLFLHCIMPCCHTYCKEIELIGGE